MPRSGARKCCPTLKERSVEGREKERRRAREIRRPGWLA